MIENAIIQPVVKTPWPYQESYWDTIAPLYPRQISSQGNENNEHETENQ